MILTGELILHHQLRLYHCDSLLYNAINAWSPFSTVAGVSITVINLDPMFFFTASASEHLFFIPASITSLFTGQQQLLIPESHQGGL
jgi:hypothetical protein